MSGVAAQALSTQPVLQSAEAWAYETLAKSCRPRSISTVSAWADEHRILSREASGEIGRWRTARTPYLREIMDNLSARSPAQRIVLKFAAQLGKTEVGLNWIGYVMDHAPRPMLVIVPTLEMRGRWVKQRLDPMLSETTALRDIIGKRSRDASNTESMKAFPGGLLVLAGANSSASLASMPVCYVLCDEIDRYPREVGQEGDPLGLIDERTKTFARRKVLLASTPTVKGLSRIDEEYEKSDQREFHVPCPECDERQVLRWRHPGGSYGLIHSVATGIVRYACVHCGALIDEHHKSQMLARGVWVPKFPERPVFGYHLSGLYSPIGLGFTWRELWQQWQDAHGDITTLKRFVNTTLGEVWEERGDSIDDLALLARVEHYPEVLPLRAITAWTDVQKDRLETTLVGWGAGEEAWVLEHVIHPGDTAAPDVWADLDAYLSRVNVTKAGIDAGYNASMVHDFCARRRWCIATKGVSGLDRPLIEERKKRNQRLRARRRADSQPVEPLGVDQGKALVYSRLRLVDPGPRYIHFPNTADFDEEYFAQLGAEKLVTRTRKGRPRQEWVQIRPRNESLDCLVGNFAVLRLLLDGKDIATLSERLVPLDDNWLPVSPAAENVLQHDASVPTPHRKIPSRQGDWNFDRRT